MTAEALMRSRYSAFALEDATYLRRSWAPATCPEEVGFVAGQTWTGLEITSTVAGGMLDQEGTVSFVARYERNGRPGQLAETSRFVRHDARWVYLGPT